MGIWVRSSSLSRQASIPLFLKFVLALNGPSGAYFAEVSLFLNIASILAVFSISPAVDRGKEVEPQIEFTTGVTSHIKPFACHIIPRSKDSEALLGGD